MIAREDALRQQAISYFNYDLETPAVGKHYTGTKPGAAFVDGKNLFDNPHSKKLGMHPSCIAVDGKEVIMRRLSFLSILVFTCLVWAQDPVPDTEIFVVDIRQNDGKIQFSAPVNITNRPGYDNQPSFLPDGKALFYTSIRDEDQADIYRYDIESKTTTRITATAESEYSPVMMADGKHFSVVRVEADGKTQRLWQFPAQGGTPSLLLEKVTEVGYYAWYDDNRLLLFIVAEPHHALQLAQVSDNATSTVTTGIGRALHKIPGQQAMSFVHKMSATEWLIKRLDMNSGEYTTLVPTLPGSEDCTWTPDGKLWMGNGGKLYQHDPSSGKEWQQLADFSSSEIQVLGRLAVSPQADRLAFVVVKK